MTFYVVKNGYGEWWSITANWTNDPKRIRFYGTEQIAKNVKRRAQLSSQSPVLIKQVTVVGI